jgi:hypothetical protein
VVLVDVEVKMLVVVVQLVVHEVIVLVKVTVLVVTGFPIVNRNEFSLWTFGFPPSPATTIVYPLGLGGVEEDVLIVKVLVKVGYPDEGLKLQDAPEGSPL